jgi:serine phosphatase RsbU (regulator of sigma subunit)
VITRPDAQSYLVQLLEQAPVGILRLEQDGAVASANPAACELLERPERELLGSYLGALFEAPKQIAESLAQAASSKERVDVTLVRGAAETALHLKLSFQTFESEETGLGVMVIMQDVTQSVTVQRQREEILSQVELLAEASASLGSSMSLEQTFEQIAEVILPMLGDWCALDLISPDGVDRIGVRHRDPALADVAEALRAFRPDADNRQHPVVRALVKEKPVIISDIDQEGLSNVTYQAEHKRLLGELGVRSVMVLPLRARHRMLGTLTLVSATNPKRYGATQLVVAQDVASRAALAIDNARLLRDHVYLARKLQESLLPPTIPRIPGVELAARYHAASETIDVGGDFYDFFATGKKSWNVVIGDVSGKGPDAAVVTTLARYTIRAASMKARAPRRILAILNEAIYSQTPPERFATVAFVRVRTDTPAGSRKVTIACGGHPLPLVMKADGAISEIGAPGTVVGLMERTDIKDHNAVLDPGDVLVLYTDGVTEARSGDHMLGIHGLRTALAGCRGRSASEIADRLAETTLDFQKTNQRDDVAIVVIKVPEETPFGENTQV